VGIASICTSAIGDGQVSATVTLADGTQT
jgi:hypothetical protein